MNCLLPKSAQPKIKLRHYPALRRRCRPITALNEKAEKIISNITNFLDLVMYWCYCLGMQVIPHPLEATMRDRLHHEIERMKAVESRMKEISVYYNEFLDLREEAKRRKQRIESLLAIVGPWDWESPKVDYVEHEAMDAVKKYPRNAIEFAALRAQLPLWEAMREYLSFVDEARIGEMEDFFRHVGFAEGNRQAIESALKRHPKVFKTRKKKREKYISLKGE